MNLYNSADGDSRVWTVYSDGDYREKPVFRSFDKHLSNAIHSIVIQIVEKEFPKSD